MAKARHRRRHPGVVLIRPDEKRRIGWRARYRDPDSGQLTKVSLSLLLRTTELREDWAAKKSKELAKRRLQLEEGAARATGTGLEAAIGKYYEAHKNLRPKTLTGYKAATDKLLAHAERTNVRSADDVTRPWLLGFREAVVNAPKRAPAPAEKRGKRRDTPKTRSGYSVNRELRGVRVVLGYLADLDLLPKVREGDLRRALKKLAVATERKPFLRAPEARALLEAALEHDRATYAATRDEHAGRRPLGSTPRFDPVAPMVAVLLLTGMRLGEGRSLEWTQVDLDALDERGAKVGEIYLKGGETKTKKERTIDLAVSPMLRLLLEKLRKQAGGKGPVFGWSEDLAAAVAKRLKNDYKAPAVFGWQVLRSTCASYLVNASRNLRRSERLPHGEAAWPFDPRERKTLHGLSEGHSQRSSHAGVCDGDRGRAAARD
jgi:integrase